jgi:hypothetical protein
MRRLAFAIMLCCIAQPSIASLLDPLAPQWNWPPRELSLGDSLTPTATLPQVLVSAARYESGMTDDLRDRPIPELGELAARMFTATPDDVPMPRPRAVIEVPNVPIEEVCDTLAVAAQRHNLPVPFFIRLIWQESRFNPRAISPVGAQGMAQFMPATAAAMGIKNPFDPLEALRSSAQLLRELVGQFGNLGLAAAAYNAGPQKIVDWLARRGKLPDETRNYVRTITGHPAERWRVTKRGQLALDVPKRAPCKAAGSMAYMVQVPAPLPPPAKARAVRAKLIAKGKDDKNQDGKGQGGKGHRVTIMAIASHRKRAIVEVSASRKRNTARTARQQPLPLIERAKAAQTHAVRAKAKRWTRSASR